MKIFISGLMLMAAVTTFVSCKKEESPVCAAGKGGNVEVVVSAQLNGETLINTLQHPDTAYIHYGSTTSPGTDPALYDEFVVSEAGEDHIHLENLKCGSYYVYRTAFDSVSQTRYTGGMAVEFSKTSGEIHVAIPVN